MPTYTYKCTACEEIVEKRQSFSDAPLTTCEQCGGALRKVIHPVGIVFKGSGWYITDSRSASTSSVNGSSSSSSEGATSTSDASSTKKDAGSSAKDTASTSSTTSAPSSSSSSSDKSA